MTAFFNATHQRFNKMCTLIPFILILLIIEIRRTKRTDVKNASIQ